MPTNRSMMWFRRDLRVGDHPALQYAGRGGRDVVPVFVIDPALVQPSGAPRLAFMYRSLRALDDSLGGALVVRHGDPATVIPQLMRETNSSEVVVSRDYGPYGRRRDSAVSDRLAKFDVELIGRGSPYALAPGTVRKGDGTPYAIFTAFYKMWQRVGHGPPLADIALKFHCPQGLPRDPIPDDPAIDCELPEPGERAAHQRWAVFVADGLDHYDIRRDTPAIPATSLMSPYLRWGLVHPRQLLADLGDGPGHAMFAKELAWRDFYADVLFHHPASARENLQHKMDAMHLDTDAAARARFAKWTQGNTGYPIVDAGMRQLLATGWMHNRVRMIVASFLVKDLHLPWQWGARHFMQHLVDGDLASNQHGWQWAAGTGTDAAPYFRVFNPAGQAARLDPDGDYIRRWVPESARTTVAMVDHVVERAEALRRYQTTIGR